MDCCSKDTIVKKTMILKQSLEILKYYNGNFNWHILTSIFYFTLFCYIDVVFQRVLSQLSLGTMLPIWQTVDQQLRCCSSWWSSWCCYPWETRPNYVKIFYCYKIIILSEVRIFLYSICNDIRLKWKLTHNNS